MNGPSDDLTSLVGIPHSDRYELGQPIGRGGMGEVLSARDTHLGREVAIKRPHAAVARDGDHARFVREARVQGRLDHPAIVPIHDLAVDDTGRPFFAMKQLAGVTLHAVIHDRDAKFTAWTRARMLRAFVDVCLAVEFAHMRGVIHRDLKPTNIILGDYNDVYVIDWGIARVVGETGDSHREAQAIAPTTELEDREPTFQPPAFDARPQTTAMTIDDRATEPGAVLGTPGYMAPEQLRGDADVGASADIYALGSILFEILAGQPLHRGAEKLGTTLFGIDAKPSLRTPDVGISPELDASCERATALDPADRFPTARALGEAVQGYLDGDRNLVLRRDLAQQQLEDARAALAAGDDGDRRRSAMRAAGRALALNPGSTEAAELITKLLLDPPASVPPEVRAEIERDQSSAARRRARVFSLVVVGVFAFLPAFVWLGVRDWTGIMSAYGVAAVSFAWSYLTARQVSPRPARAWVQVCLVALWISMFTHLCGAIVIGPGLCATALAIFATHPHLRRTSILLAVFTAAMFAPLVLEQVGLLTRSFYFEANGYRLTPPGIATHPVETQISYVIYVTGIMAGSAVLLRSTTRTSRESQQRFATQAWQLRQLLPEITTGAATASS